MLLPTCLFAFAQGSQESLLPALQQEQDDIQDALRPLNKSGRIHTEFLEARKTQIRYQLVSIVVTTINFPKSAHPISQI